MKKVIIGTYIASALGLAVFISTAASTPATVTSTRPLTPKHTIVESFMFTPGALSFIKEKIAQGYIVKSLAGGAGEGDRWIIVVEKY